MGNNDGTITIGTEVDTSGIDKGLGDIEKKVTSKGFGNKFGQMFTKIFSKATSGSNKLVGSLGKGLSSIMKSLGSIFSTVSGIAGIISMISIVGIIAMIGLAAAKSEQSRQQLEQILNIVINLIDALGQLLLPIAEKIVDFIYKVVGVLAIILEELFGIDLFSEKVSKNMKKTTKSAKELRKQLLGFDEMNILNKDGSTGIAGALGGGGTKKNEPSIYDDDEKIPSLEKKLNKLGLVTVTTDEKYQDAKSDLISWINAAEKGFGRIEKKNGMVYLFNEFGDKIEFTKNEWDRLQDDIAHNRVTSRNISIWEKALSQLQKTQAKVIGRDGRNALKDYSKDFKGFFDMIDKSNSIPKFSATYKNGMYTIKTETGKTFKVTKQEYDTLMQFIDQKKQELADKKTLEPVVTNVEWATKQTQDRLDGMFNHLEENKQKLYDFFDELGNGAKRTGDVISSQVEFLLTEDLPNNVEEGIEKTKKKLNEGNSNLKTELGNIGKTAGTSVAEGIAKGVNNILPKIEDGLNGAVSTINQLMSNMGNSAIMGAYAISGKINKLTKVKLPKIKLAKGGIINQPGKGVPLGYGAIGGEKGAEWVQPLTDEESLNRVANAIGKRIVLQPTIPIYIGNRLVAREIRNINAQDDFAFNGGL